MRLRRIYVDIPETAPDSLLCDLIAAVTQVWADRQGVELGVDVVVDSELITVEGDDE